MSEDHRDDSLGQSGEELNKLQPASTEALSPQQPPQEDTPVQQTTSLQNPQVAFEDLKNSLSDDVPDDIESSIPENPSEDEIDSLIEKYNDKMVDVLKDAKLAAVWSFVKNENERTKRQKPLLYIVAGFTAIQLLAFNGIIGVTVWLVFKNGNADVITHFIDLLKYYIGATVVELITMLAYITTGTFSTNHVKTMNKLLGSVSEKKDEKENED